MEKCNKSHSTTQVQTCMTTPLVVRNGATQGLAGVTIYKITSGITTHVGLTMCCEKVYTK